ncbi:MAG: hypothetical protein LC791_15545 [Acidobacteria bacterium]|nr:hypothetical protein [Acidobacteriota bacterium]
MGWDKRPAQTSELGAALIVAVVVIALLSGLGLALLLTLGLEPRASANQRDGAAALYAADAALELAVLDLDRSGDWNAVLAGTIRSTRTDGDPSGARQLPHGETIDLSTLTGHLTCGRPGGCSDGQRAQSSVDRPWGANNPRWAPFLYGHPAALGLSHLTADYIVVWVGDDGAEEDGDPTVDGGAASGAGRRILRLRASAWGPNRARRSVEAAIVRRCEPDPATCEIGSRVHSWRSLHAK